MLRGKGYFCIALLLLSIENRPQQINFIGVSYYYKFQ
jgi:hypothetical protein